MVEKHFPFLDEEKFVFTRDKSIVKACYMIDDKPKNLENFGGKESRFIRLPITLKKTVSIALIIGNK